VRVPAYRGSEATRTVLAARGPADALAARASFSSCERWRLTRIRHYGDDPVNIRTDVASGRIVYVPLIFG
jgi:hypothetical protein